LPSASWITTEFCALQSLAALAAISAKARYGSVRKLDGPQNASGGGLLLARLS